MQIETFRDEHWPAVHRIVDQVVTAADTYPFDPAMPESLARRIWIESPPGRTVVAIDGSTVAGTAKMGPNRSGPGDHVATASFMVAAGSRGRGIGRALCRHALDWATAEGYAGMQFNAVVEPNTAAVDLYLSLGFAVVGTVPGAFRHPELGRVGLHIMYKEL